MTTTDLDQLFQLSWSLTRRVWRNTSRVEKLNLRLQKAWGSANRCDTACRQLVADAMVMLQELRESCDRATAGESTVDLATPAGLKMEMRDNTSRWEQIDSMIRVLSGRLTSGTTQTRVADLSEGVPFLANAIYEWSSERFDILRRGLLQRRKHRTQAAPVQTPVTVTGFENLHASITPKN